MTTPRLAQDNRTERGAVIRALARAKSARRAFGGFTRSPNERAFHLGRFRQWIAYAHSISRSIRS